MSKKDFLSVIKTFAILITLIGIGLFTYMFLMMSNIILNLPSLDINKIYVNDSTKVYDMNDNLLVELGVEKRDIVNYEDISPEMVDAIISIEDARFFDHQGIDIKRIMGAFVENLKAKSFAEGASTLTQQLVKLSYLSNEKTIDRKVKEMFMSVELEKRISKELIIEAYLNRVLFGGRIYGVEKASQYFFNKHASDLNFEEAAVLAGMVQSPNRFNPFVYPENAKSRQSVVLYAMYDNGYITKNELDEALIRPIEELLVKPENSNEHERFYEYIDYVIYEIQHKYKMDPLTESIKIYTHLDPSIQDEIYTIENDETIHPNLKTQTGIVVIETKTGIIRGIGGGRNYQGSLTFNYATDAKLQPGSTIKPILDYGPVIEYLKQSPGQPYLDERIYYGTMGSRYVPIENYDHKYKGYLTMREAIIDSRNVTAVKAFREVGADKAYLFASKLGITTSEQVTEAHAIGGYQYGFSVLQMGAAYAAFGNEGQFNEPTTIRYLLKENQKFESHQKKEQAMRQDTAYLMTDILHDNMISGTALRANINDLILAGKTGQTNFNEDTRKHFNFPNDSVRDSWFIGYSTKYTTAVWLGYDRIEENTYLTPTEAKISLDIFRMVMDKIHVKREDSQPFQRPENIIEVEIETHTYPIQLPNEYTPSMYKTKELFIEGTEPLEKSDKFKPLHPPTNFIVYYDEVEGNLVFRWDKYQNDYDITDFELMEKVHRIEKRYDYEKHNLVKSYYDDQNNFKPDFLDQNNYQTTYKSYCESDIKERHLCPVSKHTLKNYLDLLEALKQHEISILMEDKKITILSEGEISELRGYQVWNGYRNGLYSNLGHIEYQIIGKSYVNESILYRGTYQNEVKIPMTFEEFINYDSFAILADYSKYRYRLRSSPNISLNPIYNMF